MAKNILNNIDEKTFLEDILSKNILEDINIFREVDVFGCIEISGNNIALSFSDPSIVLNTSKRTFKRRLIFYPKENTDHLKINFEKLPISFEDPITRTIVDSSGGIFALFAMTSSSSTTPGIMNFSFNKQLEKRNTNVSLCMKINAPYRADFYGAKVRISKTEKYNLPGFDNEFVYLITLNLDFTECKLSNKIFGYSSLKVSEAMDNLVGAINNNNYDYIPLLIEHKKLYHRVNKPIGNGNNYTLTKLSLDDSSYYKAFWQLLKIGSDMNLDIHGKNNSNKSSLISYMVKNSSYKHLILSLYANLDFNIDKKDLSNAFEIAYESRFTNKESKLTYLVLKKLLFEGEELKLKNYLKKLGGANSDPQEITFVNNNGVEVFVNLDRQKWKVAQEEAFNQLKANSDILIKEIDEDDILYKAVENIKFSLLNETAIKNNIGVNYRAIFDTSSEVSGVVYDPKYTIVDLSKETLKIKYYCTLKPTVKQYKYKDLDLKKEVLIVYDEEIIEALETQNRENLNKKIKSSDIFKIPNKIENFKKELEKEILNHKLEKANEKFIEDLRVEILKYAVVEVPETSIDEKINRELQQQKLMLEDQNINFDFYMRLTGTTEEDIKAGLRQEAMNFFKFMAVLEKVAKIENIQAEQSEIDETYNVMSEAFNISERDARLRLAIDIVKSDIIQGKALDFIVSLYDKEKEVVPEKVLSKNTKKLQDNYYQAVISLNKKQWKEIQKKAITRRNRQLKRDDKNIEFDISNKEVRESAVHEAKYALINELVVENNFDLATIPKTSIEKITSDELVLKIILITKPEVKTHEYKKIKVNKKLEEKDFKSEVLLKLLEKCKVDLPKEMIDRIVYKSEKENDEFMARSGLGKAFATLIPDQDMYSDHLRHLYINQAKLDLILEAIAKEENLNLNKVDEPETIHIKMNPYGIYYPDVFKFILEKIKEN